MGARKRAAVSRAPRSSPALRPARPAAPSAPSSAAHPSNTTQRSRLDAASPLLSSRTLVSPAVAQLQGTVLPVTQPKLSAKSRAITAEEKEANVFYGMRIARASARMVGVRQKLADEKEAAAALKKK